MVLKMKDMVNQASDRARCAGGMRGLIGWAAILQSDAVPDAVLQHAALVLADNIAATVVAEAEPEVLAAQAKLVESSSASEATVFNRTAKRVDRYSAAAANGTAATWCELDEGYRLAPAHAGAYILPALLAEAEATGTDALQVLLALTLGYEIVGRCARAFPFSTMTAHPHAVFGTLGAAAGIGRLRNYDADKLLAAISAGATMGFCGPYKHAIDGALVRNLWTGVSAWAGMRAADLAPLGIGGIAESAYDAFAGCFGTQAEPIVLTSDLGRSWAISSGYHKLYACCQYAHSAVEASLKLTDHLARTGMTADAITEIVVETHPRGLTLTETEPPTVLSAKFSMPHAVAAVAVRGTGGQGAFNREALTDPKIARLRHAVWLKPYSPIEAWPKDRPGRVTWRLADGQAWTETIENARGGADQPYSVTELFEKMKELTGTVFPAMCGVLQRLVAEPQRSLATTPWRDLVAEMTKR
jgi:2-methylcitrate dehydratase PrpD